MRTLALAVALLAVGAAPAAALEIRPLPGKVAEGHQARFSVFFDADDPYEVEFETVEGTAKTGEDFEATTFKARGGPGEGLWYDEIWVNTKTDWDQPDAPDEGDETFTVRSKDGSASATTTIQNYDPDLTAPYVEPVTARENAGRMTIRLRGQSERPFSAEYRTYDAVGLAGRDYHAASGRLDFPTGRDERTIEIGFPDDGVDQRYPKVFHLLITGEDVYDQVLRLDVDDDEYSRITVDPMTVREADGPVVVRVPVRLTVPSTSWITAPLVSDTHVGTTAGSDFVVREAPVTFPPGATETSFEVEIVGDDVTEGTETLWIHHPWGIAREHVQPATITIEDDDVAPAPEPIIEVGTPRLLDARTVGVGTRCLASSGACTGRMTFSAAGTARRKALRVRAGRARTLRFALPRRARRVRVAAFVRDAAGRTDRDTATARLRRR